MRTRIYKNCGKIFEVPTGKEAYLCRDCATEARRNSVLRERTCKICGKSFMGYPRSFFCPECSEKRKKQQQREWKRKKPARPLGSKDICISCGKEYIVNSGRQRYCPECAKIKVKENIRVHKREYREKNIKDYQEAKRATRGKRYVCPICGKEFEKHTARVTCSQECEKEYRRIKQNEADIRRGKRSIPADQRYDSGLPKSGVVGVTWNRKNGKWSVAYKGKYIGVYGTIEEAVKARKNAEAQENNK